MGHNCHSLSIDATIMISEYCPITGEHVGIIFVTQKIAQLVNQLDEKTTTVVHVALVNLRLHEVGLNSG